MARGISLHIGLNFVDPRQYNGWDGRLRGCEADAQAMAQLARARGFAPRVLLNEAATAAQVTAALQETASTLTGGDILLLTYSGHGGQIPDPHHEEADGRDETWVLYDRQLIDDELYALWAQFQAGVRILVLSDSCHSGTVTTFRFYEALPATPALGALPGAERLLFRAMPEERAAQNYEQNKSLYEAIERQHPVGDRGQVRATVLLISGCQDNQLSGDMPTGGVFTQALLRVWDNGSFTGGYALFHRRIRREMPPTQSPNYLGAGAVDRAFERQQPFTI